MSVTAGAAAPPRAKSSVTFRPFKGRSRMRAFSTTWPMPELRVSTRVAFASTSIVYVTLPTSRVTLMVGLPLTSRLIPVCANVRNPGNAASSLYGPIGRFVRMYDPVSLLMALRLMPVPVWVAVTSTPGSSAPL